MISHFINFYFCSRSRRRMKLKRRWEKHTRTHAICRKSVLPFPKTWCMFSINLFFFHHISLRKYLLLQPTNNIFLLRSTYSKKEVRNIRKSKDNHHNFYRTRQERERENWGHMCAKLRNKKKLKFMKLITEKWK